MAICRVFQNPDGSLRFLRLNERRRLPGESDADFAVRLGNAAIAGDSTLQGLFFIDADPATFPPDLSQRHKWRIQAGQVRLDPTVPDRPNPRQGLINRVRAAGTLDQVKVAIEDLILDKNT